MPAPASDRAEIVGARVAAGHRTSIIRTDDPPAIDGRLDDASWADAPMFDNLRQVEPVENGEPSERTEVRLLFDTNFLYIGIRCFDSEPDKIIATQMRRDAGASGGGGGFFGGGGSSFDDRVIVVVDTFLDRRNGFHFEMNPVGGRTDGLVENNSRLRTDWDGIWYGRATIDDEGWVAEYAIPFKTVSFDPDGDTWGLNVQRSIRRKNEDIRWAAPVQNKSLRSMADAGMVSGFEGIDQGIGLDLVPFGTASYLRNHNENDEDWDFDTGFDLFYNLSPSLKSAITVNTDFAETEVDARQVNLTRFPLFFPEKRDFFLQDAGIFSFGGIRRDPLPFFSRRIGIDANGEEVDILAGAKITGRVNDLNIGLLDIQQDSSGDVDQKNLFVGRVSYNVLDESELGMIVTNGDPQDEGSNSLVGFDFNFRDSTHNGDETIDGNLWWQRTFTPGVNGEQMAWGIDIGYPNDTVDFSLGFNHIDEEYNPGLGFVPRTGIREYFSRYRYRWRPGNGIRQIDSSVFARMITNVDNELETSDIDFTLFRLETEYGDQYNVQYTLQKEVLDESFEINDGVTLDVGSYRWDRWSFRYEDSNAKLVRFEGSASYGGFWSGDRYDLRGELEWRVSANLFLSLEYQYNDIDLDEGDFITRLGRARVNLFFTPDISWQTFVQYDNVSDTMGINSRFRWIVEPGSELFLVLNQGYDIIDSRPHSGFTEVTSKVGWTFRF